MNYEHASQVLGAEVVLRIEQAIDNALVHSRQIVEPVGVIAVEVLLMSQLAAVIAASHLDEDAEVVARNASIELRELVVEAVAVCRFATRNTEE